VVYKTAGEKLLLVLSFIRWFEQLPLMSSPVSANILKVTNELGGGDLLLSSYILPLWISFVPLPEAVHPTCILVMLSTFQNILHYDLHFFFLFTKAFHVE